MWLRYSMGVTGGRLPGASPGGHIPKSGTVTEASEKHLEGRQLTSAPVRCHLHCVPGLSQHPLPEGWASQSYLFGPHHSVLGPGKPHRQPGKYSFCSRKEQLVFH